MRSNTSAMQANKVTALPKVCKLLVPHEVLQGAALQTAGAASLMQYLRFPEVPASRFMELISELLPAFCAPTTHRSPLQT